MLLCKTYINKEEDRLEIYKISLISDDEDVSDITEINRPVW